MSSSHVKSHCPNDLCTSGRDFLVSMRHAVPSNTLQVVLSSHLETIQPAIQGQPIHSCYDTPDSSRFLLDEYNRHLQCLARVQSCNILSGLLTLGVERFPWNKSIWTDQSSARVTGAVSRENFPRQDDGIPCILASANNCPSASHGYRIFKQRTQTTADGLQWWNTQKFLCLRSESLKVINVSAEGTCMHA